MTERRRIAEIVEYDSERGVLRMIDEYARTEIQIRAGVVEKATRIAVIAELERLGYTVIAPEGDQ